MNFRRRSPTELAERAAAELARREDPYNVTQASRIYFLPNLMTAGNLFCGFMAIVQCMQARLAETALTGEYLGHTPAEYYRYAVWCIFGAAAFDATFFACGLRSILPANATATTSSNVFA